MEGKIIDKREMIRNNINGVIDEIKTVSEAFSTMVFHLEDLKNFV